MFLPVDCNFTIATAVQADLLANRATNSVTASAGGNGALKAITDNGFTLAEFGIVIPADSDFMVDQYNIEVNAPCTVQIGVIEDDGTFTPLDTHVCTGVAAGGIAKHQSPQGGFKTPLLLGAVVLRLGLKISDYGSATTLRVTGSLDLYPLGR